MTFRKLTHCFLTWLTSRNWPWESRSKLYPCIKTKLSSWAVRSHMRCTCSKQPFKWPPKTELTTAPLALRKSTASSKGLLTHLHVTCQTLSKLRIHYPAQLLYLSCFTLVWSSHSDCHQKPNSPPPPPPPSSINDVCFSVRPCANER